MKIIHCLNHYLPGSVGGTEIYTHNLALAQLAEGNDVSILIPKWEEITTWKFEGLNVRTFKSPGEINKAVRAGHEVPAGIDAFVKILSEESPYWTNLHVTCSPSSWGSGTSSDTNP